MGSEHRLDFLGIDVFAARSDYIVHAADQIHVSIFVHDANVAGEIPAVRDIFSRQRQFSLKRTNDPLSRLLAVRRGGNPSLTVISAIPAKFWFVNAMVWPVPTLVTSTQFVLESPPICSINFALSSEDASSSALRAPCRC